MKAKRFSTRKIISSTFLYLMVAGISFIILTPVYFLILLSLLPEKEVYKWPLPGLPVGFTLENYRTFLLVNPDVLPSIIRSLEVAGLTILISLSIGGMAGYAFSRFRFVGKKVAKLSILWVHMYPGVALVIPMSILLMHYGFYDSPIGLALAYSVGAIALTSWITASIFLRVPVELEEQAMVLGCNRLSAFRRVTLPLAAPGLAAAAIYIFIAAWNEVVMAVILTQFNPTLAVVVYQSVSGATGQLNLVAAGGVFMALPALIFAFLIKRYIIYMWG